MECLDLTSFMKYFFMNCYLYKSNDTNSRFNSFYFSNSIDCSILLVQKLFFFRIQFQMHKKNC